MRSEFDKRDHKANAEDLYNIYSDGALNCSLRTIGQIAFEEVHGLEEGNIHVQYEPWNILGVNMPGNIPVENHIVYEGSNDTTIYDWKHEETETEEFGVDDIVGLRAINLLVEDRYDDFDEVRQEFENLRGKRPDSEFLEGFSNALKVDNLSEGLPRPAQSLYESVTDKMT